MMAKLVPAPGFYATLIALCRSLAADLSGQYRPERHYMRGPGPKWREKHARIEAEDDSHAPSLETPAAKVAA
jgi:hypothetical protein